MVAPNFTITYRISLYHDEDINAKIENLCREQSVELPRSVLSHHIEATIVARLLSLSRNPDATYNAVIQYPLPNASDEITQLLNVMFGNISLVPGIQVVDADWTTLSETIFKGPRFGISGIRERIGVHDRALSSTALKPVGTSARELAGLAYQFALGGIDLIKDDHGLTNQSYAPFADRLKYTTEAVAKANAESGRNSCYIPHITAPGDELWRRYELAVDHGAQAVMVCPQLCGPEVMQRIAAHDTPLPVMAHPAFSGAYVQDRAHGFSKSFFYGALWRAMGADFTIFPNHSGRFSFTMQECVDIVDTARDPQLPFAPIFPTPGGGMQRETVPYFIDKYGIDTVFLIGGSLYEHPGGIRQAAQEILTILQEAQYEK